METIPGALIGAFTLIVVSFIGWFSQRATRESRLLLKIERFGNAYSGIPESAEKSAFKEHFLKRVQELNAEFDEKPNRVAINAVTVATSILGVIAIFLLAPTTDTTALNWLSIALGLVLGFIIGGVNFAATWFINRRASAKAFEQRVEQFKRGEM